MKALDDKRRKLLGTCQQLKQVAAYLWLPVCSLHLLWSSLMILLLSCQGCDTCWRPCLGEDSGAPTALEPRQASGAGSALTQGKAWMGKALILRKCSARQWHSTNSFAYSMGLFIYTRMLKSTGKPEILGRNYTAPEHLFHTLVVPDKKNAFLELFKVLTMKQLEDMKLQSYILFLFKPI